MKIAECTVGIKVRSTKNTALTYVITSVGTRRVQVRVVGSDLNYRGIHPKILEAI